ncbi:alanine racemase [Gluconacetobacter entanii]|uniref:alanine racemase n=1 Tax=Gluconacetobacter entanii TaxID=108528 RepID=UPI001C9364B8|nr:alanine racemase [Gluconacetobacter entanii]MBY4639210.1 alanine racemase [Gluconacetobacter entanii]MCW4580131.1 alanine racemase [Gluconacetobacter entanii]MCW4584719.1 alanine racemase [Gluconacetobacter entanii]MCW4588019.1 alanine racemase [Gluconacetobacter entanii]
MTSPVPESVPVSPAPASAVSSHWPRHRAGATLRIDLDAIAANYRLVRDRLTPRTTCAAVVKADAYGLGLAQVAPALQRAGAEHFYVAHLEEGIALRPHVTPATRIFVLHGPLPGTEEEFTAHGLTPVLNSIEQIAGWRALARRQDRVLRAVIQLDTGMSRFGLSMDDVRAIADDADLLAGITPDLIISHLACADTPRDPANAQQRARLLDMAALLPAAPMALSASSGIFLGPDYHFDMVRPGAALYGIAPNEDGPNPLRPVVRLSARILQVRDIAAGDGVGYGLTYRAPGPRRIATIGAGYADGCLRQGASHGAAWFGETRLPILGRISMDSITIDITDVPAGALGPDMAVDLLGPQHDVDAAARAAGTIGYEILTSLGHRYHRTYVAGG